MSNNRSCIKVKTHLCWSCMVLHSCQAFGHQDGQDGYLGGLKGDQQDSHEDGKNVHEDSQAVNRVDCFKVAIMPAKMSLNSQTLVKSQLDISFILSSENTPPGLEVNSNSDFNFINKTYLSVNFVKLTSMQLAGESITVISALLDSIMKL